MMHMTFYWGKQVTLLTHFWHTDSWLGYLITLFACFLLAGFYQNMEARRIRFEAVAFAAKIDKPKRVNRVSLGSALLFGLNSAIGYLVMLVIMCFNGGVFVAIILGLLVGYFMFRTGDQDTLVLDVENNSCACS